MIKVSLCYSNKSGQEFASCGLSDIELDMSLLDNPTALRDKIAASYQLCEEMVNAQLGVAALTVPARTSAPPPQPATPARPATPPPGPPPVHANGSTGDDRPPTSARSLGGWSKKRNLTKWFSDLGRANNRPGMISEWDDAFAVWAYQNWLSQQPVANGVQH